MARAKPKPPPLKSGPPAPGTSKPGPFTAPPPPVPKGKPGAKPGGSKPPPAPPIPQSKPATSAPAAFREFINAHPIMRPYADLISGWAAHYNVDLVVAAVLFWHESFSEAKRLGKDPKTIMSPTGEGFGIGQINPKVWLGAKTPWGETITLEKLKDPEFNIRFALSYFAGLPGTYDQKYQRYSGGADFVLSSGLPKGYVPEGGPSPREKAESEEEQRQADKGVQSELYDRWIVRNPNGTIGFQKITDPNVPPKNVVYQYGKRKDGSPLGAPLRESDLRRTKAIWDDVFISFTGKPASVRQITNFLETGVSQTGLMTTLSKMPTFRSSPKWQQYASGIIGIGKELFGRNWKPDMELVRKAIVESWEEATLRENLRNRPEYLQGPVYKGKVAAFNNIYTGIYGVPNNPGRVTIKEAAFQDWDEITFASWLRGQPEYTKSPEYQAKVIGFLDQMGLITGSVPTLQPGKAPANPMKPVAALPNAPQVAGKPTTPRTTSPTGDLVPRLGG